MNWILSTYLWVTGLALIMTIYISLGDLAAFRRAGKPSHTSASDWVGALVLACIPGLQILMIGAGILYLADSDDPISNFFHRVFVT